MPIAPNQLPDDIDALKSLVVDQAVRNEQLQSKVIILQEQLNLALAKRYAASSEKISPDQVCMFNEAKAAVDTAPDTDDDLIIVPAHTRKKRGRKPLPDNLPRVVAANALTHVGCMAHARRKFSEAVKAQGKKKGKAYRGHAQIQKLYRIEKQARRLDPEERYAHRQQQARPVLDDLRSWLDDTLPLVPLTSATGKALNYLHREWYKLIRYLDDGRLEIDNNGAENAIRPFVLGRKNWLFSASVKGVKASANLYSLIETAKANKLEPYAYLRYLFSELPKVETVECIEALLPGNINQDQIRID
jgi:hypothetical protein